MERLLLLLLLLLPLEILEEVDEDEAMEVARSEPVEARPVNGSSQVAKDNGLSYLDLGFRGLWLEPDLRDLGGGESSSGDSGSSCTLLSFFTFRRLHEAQVQSPRQPGQNQLLRKERDMGISKSSMQK
jgi:hypothetical protein